MFVQDPGEVTADLAEALDGDGSAGELAAAVGTAEGGADTVRGPERCHVVAVLARVAGIASQGYVSGGAAHVGEVGCADPDVFGDEGWLLAN